MLVVKCTRHGRQNDKPFRQAPQGEATESVKITLPYVEATSPYLLAALDRMQTGCP